MKNMSKLLMSTVLAFGLLSGSVGALGAESVSQSSVTTFDVVHPVLELKVGETYQFGGKGYSAWLISGQGVVSIDQFGKVTALSPGDALVHVYPTSGIKQIRPIKVVN
ncbi:Ig-like domain-containing protein [Paenibacillus assamensis]|uniref:Ig-like domain-containing protein n=1 Tax=Paenibacillus assamensis TaxID=311244 RepID=UPI0003FCEB79|nr:Ig-like domain-containing protein [Paenibacillus assamensis]